MQLSSHQLLHMRSELPSSLFSRKARVRQDRGHLRQHEPPAPFPCHWVLISSYRGYMYVPEIAEMPKLRINARSLFDVGWVSLLRMHDRPKPRSPFKIFHSSMFSRWKASDCSRNLQVWRKILLQRLHEGYISCSNAVSFVENTDGSHSLRRWVVEQRDVLVGVGFIL